MKFKQFKKVLDEKYINNNKEYHFLLDGYLPLAPKLWDRINTVKYVKRAYHTTDLDGYKKLIKLQGTKKQISAFTKGDSLVASGVETSGGILVELSGDSTLIIEGDAFTSLDRNGTRWWDLSEMYSIYNDEIFEKLRTNLMNITRKIFTDILKETDIEDYNIKYYTEHNNLIIMSNTIKKYFSQQQKALFIKTALNAVEQYLKKTDLKKIIATANKLGKELYKNNNYYNEVVLHNIKITNVYGIMPFRGFNYKTNEVYNLYRKGRLKLSGWTNAENIVDINNNKVKAAKSFDELTKP